MGLGRGKTAVFPEGRKHQIGVDVHGAACRQPQLDPAAVGRRGGVQQLHQRGDVHRADALFGLFFHQNLALVAEAAEGFFHAALVDAIAEEGDPEVGPGDLLGVHAHGGRPGDADVGGKAGVEAGCHFLHVKFVGQQAEVHELAQAFKPQGKGQGEGGVDVAVEALGIPHGQAAAFEGAGHKAHHIQVGDETVPASTASGRSVVSRKTSTGLPRAGASSWMPPLSVSTMSTLPIKLAKGS